MCHNGTYTHTHTNKNTTKRYKSLHIFSLNYDVTHSSSNEPDDTSVPVPEQELDCLRNDEILENN